MVVQRNVVHTAHKLHLHSKSVVVFGRSRAPAQMIVRKYQPVRLNRGNNLCHSVRVHLHPVYLVRGKGRNLFHLPALVQTVHFQRLLRLIAEAHAHKPSEILVISEADYSRAALRRPRGALAYAFKVQRHAFAHAFNGAKLLHLRIEHARNRAEGVQQRMRNGVGIFTLKGVEQQNLQQLVLVKAVAAFQFSVHSSSVSLVHKLPES